MERAQGQAIVDSTLNTPRDPSDLARELQKIADAIDAADRHFQSQADADAALHLAVTVRPNPLASLVSTARADIHRVIEELLQT